MFAVPRPGPLQETPVSRPRTVLNVGAVAIIASVAAGRLALNREKTLELGAGLRASLGSLDQGKRLDLAINFERELT